MPTTLTFNGSCKGTYPHAALRYTTPLINSSLGTLAANSFRFFHQLPRWLGRRDPGATRGSKQHCQAEPWPVRHPSKRGEPCPTKLPSSGQGHRPAHDDGKTTTSVVSLPDSRHQHSAHSGRHGLAKHQTNTGKPPRRCCARHKYQQTAHDHSKHHVAHNKCCTGSESLRDHRNQQWAHGGT